MPCPECEECRRRLKAAIMRGKFAEAAGVAVAGAAEMAGKWTDKHRLSPPAETITYDASLSEKANAMDGDGPSEVGSEDAEKASSHTPRKRSRFARGDDADNS